MRPDFLMVHEAVADAFLAQVRRCVQSFYGDAQGTEWLGRCINDAAFARLAAMISGAAELLYPSLNPSPHPNPNSNPNPSPNPHP